MLHDTHRIMELNEVLLILGVFLPSFFVVIWQLNRLNPGKNRPKKGVDAADSSVSELFGVQTEQIKEIIKSKNNQIKSLQHQYRQDQDEIDPNISTPEVKYGDLKVLASEFGVNPLVMELPYVKKNILKYTKGMSMEEIIESTKEITKLMGGKGFKLGSKGETEDPVDLYLKQNRAGNI